MSYVQIDKYCDDKCIALQQTVLGHELVDRIVGGMRQHNFVEHAPDLVDAMTQQVRTSQCYTRPKKQVDANNNLQAKGQCLK